MKEIEFAKYQALENDFLVIELDRLSGKKGELKRLAIEICNRHKGIGADGVLYHQKLRGLPQMRIFNADGSEAEVSGNGLRIFAQYLRDTRQISVKRFTVGTMKGENGVEVISRQANSQVTQITLASPRFSLKEIPMVGTGEYFINAPFRNELGELLGTGVNVGNPHIVFFVDSFNFDWQAFGKITEKDHRFPECVNVEFAVIESRTRVRHCSWERGAGVTRASGTGAASTVAAGVINGLLDRKVKVFEPAGELLIQIESLEQNILLTGPSVLIGGGTFFFNQNAKDRR